MPVVIFVGLVAAFFLGIGVTETQLTSFLYTRFHLGNHCSSPTNRMRDYFEHHGNHVDESGKSAAEEEKKTKNTILTNEQKPQRAIREKDGQRNSTISI